MNVTRTEDHILVRDGDEILYDGPDWGLLFFVEALQGTLSEDEEQADVPPSSHRGQAGAGAFKRT